MGKMKHHREALRNCLRVALRNDAWSRCTTSCVSVAHLLRRMHYVHMAAVETDVEVLTDGVVPNLMIQVKVRDDSHPRIEGRFDCIEDQSRFIVMAISVHARAGHELERVVTPSGIRELPLVLWEKIAKAAAQKWLRGPDVLSSSQAWSFGERERAEMLVRHLHPDLDPATGKGAARKFESLVRYAEVLNEYSRWLSEGVEDPTSVIAERRDVAPATVRSWLHRGREAGLDAAQRDMALGSRDPRWVSQLRMFQKIAAPHHGRHSEILWRLHWTKARYLMSRGALMQKRRETCKVSPETYAWHEMMGQVRHLKSETLKLERSIREDAETLRAERARLRSRGIEPPRISRWIWPLVEEDLPPQYWPKGEYVPYSFNWDLGED